jgi:hypothetical protein
MKLFTNINRFMDAQDTCILMGIIFTTAIIVSDKGIKFILKTK